MERTLRLARMAQGLTIGWMVIEGGVAIGAGFAARSVVLTAFGVDSLIELAASAVVLIELLRRETRQVPVDQAAASRLVGLALYGLIAYILLASAAGLLLGVQPSRSPVGVAITAVSIPVMAGLWRWRLHLAQELNDPALRADASCSVVCLYLAGVALAGLLLNQLVGWWWADSVAALGLIWWIRNEAREAWQAPGRVDSTPCCCPPNGPHPCTLPGCPCL
jgi:divalent metal cation (Fe/Co/Zn/Cd) transporter